jgi:hypothetical protein
VNLIAVSFSIHFPTKASSKSAKCRQFKRFQIFFLASQASDVGSIPIARSKRLVDSIVYMPVRHWKQTSYLGVLPWDAPNPSQLFYDAFDRSWAWSLPVQNPRCGASWDGSAFEIWAPGVIRSNLQP